jgi:hypothetical protein
MWPWEHATLGYLLYSLGSRALGRDPPSGRETIVILTTTQLPDVVDKPLSWGLGWFPSGFAIAHSVFVAMPLGVGVLALGGHRGRLRLSIAAVVGYWSHLLGDALNPLRAGERVLFSRVLWPVSEMPPYETDYGIGRGVLYLREFVGSVPAMEPTTLAWYVAVPVGGVLLWLADGAPGKAFVADALTALRRR